MTTVGLRMEEHRCAHCDAILFEPPGERAGPCPVCGEVGRSIAVKLEDRIALHDGYRVKAYRAGSSQFFIDECSGPSYYRVGAEWHHVMRVIDRENDRYTEVVRVLRTGEVIREIDEPLSQHTDRGGSKNQAPR
jgi:hypothetical protein